MLFKKKKLLNIKYKSAPDSIRLLDKQFTIDSDSNRFRINIKDCCYYFKRKNEKASYCISTDEDAKTAFVNFGKAVKLKHRDGTEILFTLHEDFLYSFDCHNIVYLVLALVLNAVIFASIELAITAKPVQMSVKKETFFAPNQKVSRSLATAVINSAMTVSNNISKTKVEEIIAKHSEKIHYCYINSVLAKTTFGEELKLVWSINSNGRASRVNVIHGAFNDEKLNFCISTVFASIHFPRPSRGTATATYHYFRVVN